MKTIHDPRFARLVAALKQRRRQLGMSQDEVAARLGCCRTRVVKIEQRELRLDVLGYFDICRVYRLNPGRLMGLLGKEDAPASGVFFFTIQWTSQPPAICATVAV